MLTTKIEFLDGVKLEVYSDEPFTPEEIAVFKMLTAAEFKVLVRIELGPGLESLGSLESLESLESLD